MKSIHWATIVCTLRAYGTSCELGACRRCKPAVQMKRCHCGQLFHPIVFAMTGHAASYIPLWP